MTIIAQLWNRIHFLVPDPQCRTSGDDFDTIVWTDARTQPTEAELNAVTRAQIDSVNPQKVRETDRASGITKLKTSAGLTDAEVDALRL
jgi:hypothetical protein